MLGKSWLALRSIAIDTAAMSAIACCSLLVVLVEMPVLLRPDFAWRRLTRAVTSKERLAGEDQPGDHHQCDDRCRKLRTDLRPSFMAVLVLPAASTRARIVSFCFHEVVQVEWFRRLGADKVVPAGETVVTSWNSTSKSCPTPFAFRPAGWTWTNIRRTLARPTCTFLPAMAKCLFTWVSLLASR